jgi:hypothetical protein
MAACKFYPNSKRHWANWSLKYEVITFQGSESFKLKLGRKIIKY